MSAFRRIRKQEGGLVLRWFEDKDGNTISVIRNAFGGTEMRISGRMARFTVPAMDDMTLRFNDKQLLAVARRAIHGSGVGLR